MTVSEAKRLKELERENAELKRMVADRALDIRNAEGCERKKMVSLAERRRCVTYLKAEYEISEWRACQAMELHRSSYTGMSVSRSVLTKRAGR